jgi:hypothetical protein
MSSASFVDGFGPTPRSRQHRTTLRFPYGHRWRNREGRLGSQSRLGYRFGMGVRVCGLESVVQHRRVGDADDRALG